MRCYLCQSSNLTVIRTKLRHNIRREVFSCSACGLVYLAPIESDLKGYYEDSYRKTYSPVLGQTVSSRETFEIYSPLQKSRVDDLSFLLAPTARVLDVGCSAGQFLFALKDKVKECIGIEFNRRDVAFVNSELSIRTYGDSIENTDLPLGYFDLITVLQVLEHVDDPIKFLTTLRPYLKSDGVLVVEVPNLQDALLSVYKSESYADFWYREPHVFYYSPNTLPRMMERSGFLGSTKTVQRYSFFNHMNWLFTSAPQASVNIGMSAPRLVDNEEGDRSIRETLNQWIQKVDAEYRQILTQYDAGDCLLFIGRKSD